jgi:hypothetical protein
VSQYRENSMGTIVKEGELFKLPTWSKGPASQLEKQFKLRYFTLVQQDDHARLIYFKSAKGRSEGGAPLGSIDIITASFERVNKLDFELVSDKKRLYCRAFSEVRADEWEAALASAGAGRDVIYED